MKKEKLKLPAEIVYVLSVLLISFSVAMVASADFGVSMIVAPAYIVSEKVGFLTFGQSEYVVQALLFVVLCVLMRGVRLQYFFSFVTCLVYGAALDGWRLIIPLFNPNVTPPGSMAFWLRCVLFVCGMLLTSFSVALFYRTYLYPQVYDFFVKAVSERYGLNRTKFKIGFDVTCLAVAVALTLLFFRKFVGIGVGTLIMTVCNGALIGFFGKVLDRWFIYPALLPKAEEKFRI